LEVLAKQADVIESDEESYKAQQNKRFDIIHDFLERVHEVVGATYKEHDL